MRIYFESLEYITGARNKYLLKWKSPWFSPVNNPATLISKDRNVRQALELYRYLLDWPNEWTLIVWNVLPASYKFNTKLSKFQTVLFVRSAIFFLDNAVTYSAGEYLLSLSNTDIDGEYSALLLFRWTDYVKPMHRIIETRFSLLFIQ